MNRYLAVVMWLGCLVAVARPQAAAESACMSCHLEQDPPYSTPAEHFSSDIHARAGFGCEVCHGGDPEAWDYDEAKAPSAGFIGIPAGRKVVEVCSRCHSDTDLMRRYNPSLPTDQTPKYWSSGHGKSLQQGNLEAAQCASCHGTHAIKSSGDPASPVYHTNVAATCGNCHSDRQLMDKFRLSDDVVDQYNGSVHGIALLERGDIAAPTCNNCHGNHGAAPPEVESIQEVCGICHINNQTLFNQTKKRQVFANRGLHGCVVCHTAHDIQHLDDSMVSITTDGVCARCHEPGDPGALQAGSMRAVLDSLSAALNEAQSTLSEAENRGLEVEEPLLDLQAANTILVQSRTLVHTFDSELIREEAKPGFELAASVGQESIRLMHDFRMRKVGLGIASIFISFLALVLYLYIRTLDKRE